MKGRTREQLYVDVVNAVLDATTDSRGGIEGQQALADEVRCSKATLTAEMPAIVAKSTEMLPGYAVQIGQVTRAGVKVFRYRVVDLQSQAELTESKRRILKAETVVRRAIAEVSVKQAGPGAQAATQLLNSGVELIVTGLEMLEASL